MYFHDAWSKFIKNKHGKKSFFKWIHLYFWCGMVKLRNTRPMHMEPILTHSKCQIEVVWTVICCHIAQFGKDHFAISLKNAIMLITLILLIWIKEWIKQGYISLIITEIVNQISFSKICNCFSLQFSQILQNFITLFSSILVDFFIKLARVHWIYTP
jgi:hypothetical protein